MAKDDRTEQMRSHLASARRHVGHAAGGDDLAERDPVRALVAARPDADWAALSDEERFLLYEISEPARAAAPSERVARAYCAGLRVVPFEWWGTPRATATPTARRLIDLAGAAAPCLGRLLDDDQPLLYRNGELNMMVEQFGWTRGDLAATLAAAIVGADYDARAAPDVRRARRAELLRALTALGG